MFADRREAGHRLGGALRGHVFVRPVVLAVPRGGVEVGAAIAEDIGAELDVLLARKLRAPDQPELAIGAVCEDGVVQLSEIGEQVAAANPGYLARERAAQIEEIARRAKIIRAVRPKVLVEGRSVIVTDDGIATGSTIHDVSLPLPTPRGRQNARQSGDVQPAENESGYGVFRIASGGPR